MHTEPRAARLFLLARPSPRPGNRCRYPAMARFSIRQLFIVIALVALLLAASGVILKSRWQQSEIDVQNYSLEVAWMERPIPVSYTHLTLPTKA